MVLEVGGIKNLFPHSKEFDQGLGKIRKGAATFVVALDGSGDFTDIQEAIDALPSSGGSIFIKEGTYLIYNNIEIRKDNIKIEGTGFGTVLKFADYRPEGHRTLFDIGDGTNALKNIIIENLLIDGNDINQSGIIYYLIRLRKTSNSRIARIKMINCQQGTTHPFYIEDNSNDNLLTEINIDDYTKPTITGSERNIVSNNIFKGGIAISNLSNLTTINSNKLGDVIFISNSNYVIVSNNSLEFTDSHGIELSSCNYCSVSGNVMETPGGIYLTNSTKNVIIGNTNINCPESSIKLNASDNNIIKGNSIYNSNTDIFDNAGIEIINSDKNAIIGNIVDTTKGDGINIDLNSDRNIIDGCIILNATGTNLANNGTNTKLGDNITA